ncbi:ATP-binding cassette domain-containing protein [Arthrobacter globiformis]|uniref:ATP-binding cassette domain-containing protein n=1 Tax=Arthrobacter globiformis TaxID=1665 RepID=UPI0027D84ACD|nr:ATP-binding cassette domain-containing protein [Arthrobacter globiformis]
MNRSESSDICGEKRIHRQTLKSRLRNGAAVAELQGTSGSHIIRATERIGLTGAQGVGKTAVLESLIHGRPHAPGRAGGRLLTDHVGYWPQHGDILDRHSTALENIQAVARDVPPDVIRTQLARFLLRANNANRRVSNIPPDERFRVALARLLLTGPPPELLVLDEPARCDKRATSRLLAALLSYPGALIVVSNREALLNRLDLDLILVLNDSGALTESTPKRCSAPNK